MISIEQSLSIQPCPKCERYPSLTLTSETELQIQCDCSYSKHVTLQDYISQMKYKHSNQKYCLACKEWIKDIESHNKKHSLSDIKYNID